MDRASGKSLYKMRQFSQCSPFALPLLPAWNLGQMLEMRQPCYDYEETKTHTKESRVEILESDDSLMSVLGYLLLITGGKETFTCTKSPLFGTRS